MEKLLAHIVRDDTLHQRWLATLSHLENCGARKIVQFQPPENVPLQVLQHAAEETRHAFYFKKLMGKIDPSALTHPQPLLGGAMARRYLHLLDLKISQALRRGALLQGRSLKRGSYLLTTFAIEKRADVVYPLYERCLKFASKPYSIRAIIKEEENHLRQIEADIAADPVLYALKGQVQGWEHELFAKFISQVARDLGKNSPEI